MSLKNFKSFSDQKQTLSDLKRVNIIIGRNNCGKSNFLEYFTERESENHPDKDEFENAESVPEPFGKFNIKSYLKSTIDKLIDEQNLPESLKDQIDANLKNFTAPELKVDFITTESWHSVFNGFSLQNIEGILNHQTFEQTPIKDIKDRSIEKQSIKRDNYLHGILCKLFENSNKNAPVKPVLKTKIETIIKNQKLPKTLIGQLEKNLKNPSLPDHLEFNDKGNPLTEPWNPAFEGFSLDDVDTILDDTSIKSIRSIHPDFKRDESDPDKQLLNELLRELVIQILNGPRKGLNEPHYIFKMVNPIATEDSVNKMGSFLEEIKKSKKSNEFKRFLDSVSKLIEGFSGFRRINEDQKMRLGFETTDKDELPFESLGSGIQQVVKLMWMCKSSEDEFESSIDKLVICIDEPELHLHPTLQRMFIQHICQSTKAQYLIATHSPTILNASPTETQIFRFWLDDKAKTNVTRIDTNQQIFAACADIGCKASDILQANCIVWVEGPSDVIYLRHWIKKHDPELQEGFHFSLMFYGGSNIAQIAIEDDDSFEESYKEESLKQLIEILPINRNFAIVMDRDRNDENEALKGKVQEVKEKAAQGLCYAWVTDGREIENYLDVSVVQQIDKFKDRTIEPYDKLLDSKQSKKMPFATDYVEKDTSKGFHTSGLGTKLQSQIQSLCSFIRKSNHLS